MKVVKPSSFFKGCVILPVFLCTICYAINVVSFLIPLNDAYNKWESTKPQSYTVVVKYGTYWGTFNSSQEMVTNGILLNSTTTSFAEPAIDRLFDSVRSCAFSPLGFMFCRVEYDSTYGYPTKFVVEDLDLGSITEISEFTPEQ